MPSSWNISVQVRNGIAWLRQMQISANITRGRIYYTYRTSSRSRRWWVDESNILHIEYWLCILLSSLFLPFLKQCATHTHQLALDMQLSLSVPILVFFLQCKLLVGILLMAFLLLLSATLRYIATMNNYLSLVIFHGISWVHLRNHLDNVPSRRDLITICTFSIADWNAFTRLLI